MHHNDRIRRITMKKRNWLLTAILAGVVLMAGCSGDAETSATGTADAASTNEASQTAEADEKTAEADEKTAEAETKQTAEAEQTTTAATEEDIAPAETEEQAPATEDASGNIDIDNIDLSSLMATCEETDGNIVLTMPLEGFSMRVVYVFDENKTLIDTKSQLVPGTITSLEEMYAAAGAEVDMSEFVYEDGVYTASTGTADMEGSSYDETLASCQATIEFYNALLSWGSEMQEEYADVSADEYTVEAYVGTGYDYITETTDGGFSMTSVEVPAVIVDVSIRTEVDFDDLVAPEVTVEIMGETADVTDGGTMKSGDVATWSFQYILAEGETVEALTVTVDGTAYDVTVA